MRNKIIVFTVGIFITALLAGFIVISGPPAPQKYEMVIRKVDGVWKVVDATDIKKTQVHARKKDVIVWTSEGTDAYLQFPDKLFNPVDPEDSLKHGFTKFLKSGKKVKLRVRDDVLAGTYEYAVFCTADGVFAEGDSPPKIVIE
jgi:CO dehydrogenase/acetyl-CoA synthase alpha subunit